MTKFTTVNETLTNECNAEDGRPKPQKKCETLSSPKQSSEDHFWDYWQRLLGARNEKKRSVLLAHEHFLSERNDTDARSKFQKTVIGI